MGRHAMSKRVLSFLNTFCTLRLPNSDPLFLLIVMKMSQAIANLNFCFFCCVAPLLCIQSTKKISIAHFRISIHPKNSKTDKKSEIYEISKELYGHLATWSPNGRVARAGQYFQENQCETLHIGGKGGRWAGVEVGGCRGGRVGVELGRVLGV